MTREECHQGVILENDLPMYDIKKFDEFYPEIVADVK